MIFIAGKKIERMEDLSETFSVITELIQDATQWLIWAFSEPAHGFWLSVRTEGELLTRMVEGLHGTALVKIDNHDQGLLVHPLKLMELANRKGLQLIAAIVNAQEGYQERLKRNGLFTRADLDQGLDLLTDLGVNRALIFQTMTLADLIRIKHLQASLKNQNVTKVILKEAAQFAVLLAQTAGEFSACFKYYQAVCEKLGDDGSKKQLREHEAMRIWKELAPLSNGLLETFSFSPEFIWETLADDIKACLLNGFRLGFVSLPKAIHNIMAQITFTDQIDEKDRANIKQYMNLAQETVVKGTLERIWLSQDGLIRSYVFTRSSVRTVLEVDTWGIVTLASYNSTIA